MDFKSARLIAIEIGYQLMPHCDRLNIAGSIRRKKPQVKDVELICLPKKRQLQAALFTEPTFEVVAGFRDAVARLGTVIKGKPDGKMMQIELHEGIMLDLFMPDDFDYFRQFAIRTGSADYSARIIAGGWVAKGWCGSDQGLRLQKDCQERISGGKKTWICLNPDAERPPAWQSEEEFFAWLGVEWVEPKLRNV